MGKIKANALIDLFERMEREHWAYEWGAAHEGCVDCSGAFVYAFKALGGPAIAHGSNTIARKHCGPLVPASEARPGYAMLRWREDGEPERYEQDGMGDFYHIGLKGHNGKVLNAKSASAGFVESPDSGWKYAAPLLDVDYSEDAGGGENMAEETALFLAQVATQNDPLRVRDEPGVGGSKLGSIPRGAVVDVLDTSVNAGWWRVRYEDMTGYASSDYLRRIDAGAEDAESVGSADGVAEAVTVTTLKREDADGCIMLLGRWHVSED